MVRGGERLWFGKGMSVVRGSYDFSSGSVFSWKVKLWFGKGRILLLGRVKLSFRERDICDPRRDTIVVQVGV
jgi:hypothetical protein